MTTGERVEIEKRMDALKNEIYFWEGLLAIEERLCHLSPSIPEDISKKLSEELVLLKSIVHKK